MWLWGPRAAALRRSASSAPPCRRSGTARCMSRRPRRDRRPAGSRTSSSRCRTGSSACCWCCTRSPPRSTTTCARLVDPLRQELAVLVLAVVHQLLGVFRLVELADSLKMPNWRNMPSMPNVRLSSGTIGTTACRSACRAAACRGRDERHRGRDRALGALQRASKVESAGSSDSIAPPRRQVAAERRPPLRR